MAIEEFQDGRYRRVRLLGSGGMGEVYLMQDMRVSRQVAIKVMHAEGATYPGSEAAGDAVRLFQREARAIAALEHPNILPLYDFGEETHDGATITYMVMPYCAEGSLAGWLKQRGNATPLSPRDVSSLVEQAAEALQYAHDQEVVHLDVKPSNFLLRSNKKHPNHPTLLLADFGIARSFSTVASASLTIRGTPTSMAPEQWSSTPGAATDQYALAVMAYELLVGRPPFVGSMEQLMYQHFSVQPPAPGTFNPRLSAEIDAVLLRALAKKPEERFPSIAAFAAAFDEAVQLLPAEPTTDIKESNTSDIYSTLSISPSEADAGISRLITLPGGKKLNVPIPAGTRDGEVIRVQGPADAATPAEELLITVAIKQPEKTPSSPRVINTDEARHVSTPAVPISGHDLPTVAASERRSQVSERQPSPPPSPKRSSALRFWTIGIVAVLIVALLGASALYYISNHSSNAPQAQANTPSHTPSSQTKTTPTATPIPRNGLYIAGSYNGAMQNQTTRQAAHINVHIVQRQGNGALNGTVTFTSPAQGVHSLAGNVDMQGNFTFTVQEPSDQPSLYMFGQTQPGNFLKGFYCNNNTTSCTAATATGFFTIGPRY